MIKYRASISMTLHEMHERSDIYAFRTISDTRADGYRYVIFMSISQRLIQIVREGGAIRKTDVHTFSNGPRTSNTSYNAMDDGLYVAAETPQPRWLIWLGDGRRDLEHRRQEGLVLANEEWLLRRAVHVQYPEQDTQDHSEEGQQSRGHLSPSVPLPGKGERLSSFSDSAG